MFNLNNNTTCILYLKRVIHPISFNYKASFIYDVYSHVLRALTFSQLLAVHVLTGGSEQSDSRL